MAVTGRGPLNPNSSEAPIDASRGVVRVVLLYVVKYVTFLSHFAPMSILVVDGRYRCGRR